LVSHSVVPEQSDRSTRRCLIGYDNANRRTSLTLPNGVVVAYGYDAASRVTSITYTQGQTTIGNLTYTYDANGRRNSMGGSLAKVNLPAAIASATYNANNQLSNWNGTTLSYDLNGNMTYDGATTYTWDARNHLGAFGSTSFSYDTLGRRTRNASGTAFLYDGVNPAQELSGSTVTANLLTGLGVDEIFTRTDSAGTRNFLTDALGSTLALTDSAGTVQTQYTYEPFGKTTASGQANTSTFQYTGRENDGTGMYYYRARYYHPTLQRFISEDPLDFLGGLNLYGYGLDSPVNLTDPLGQSTGNAGITFGGQSGPLSGQGFGGIVYDNQGNWGWYWGGGGGLGVGGRVFLGGSGSTSNGRNICDFGGPFANINLGAGLGPYASADGYAGTTGDGYHVVGGGVTLGAGVGGGASGGGTKTWVYPFLGPLARRKVSCQ
jgi:RHS repeat-associated protein